MDKIIEKSEFDEILLITVEHNKSNNKKEAIITEYQDDYKCWLNYCKHITDVKIHKGNEPPVRDNELVCHNHGAMFNFEDGLCTYGPCKGARLDPINVEVKCGSIHITDKNYKFVKLGGIEEDEQPKDMSGEDTFF